MILFLFVALLLSEVNAHPKISSIGGTVLVATMTSNNVTVAEDSRIGGAGKYCDEDCKIIALGGKLIFGFSGPRKFDIIYAHHPKDVAAKIHWEAHAAAVHAYQLAQPKTTQETARQFAIIATTIFANSIKAVGPKDFIAMTGGHPDDLSMAVFVGMNVSTSRPEGYAVRFSYSASKQSACYQIMGIVQPTRPGDPYGAFDAGSDTKVIEEIKSGQSFWATSELKRWNQSVAGKKFDEKAILYAVELVNWEINYSHDPNIGGKVDYMVLTRDGIADHRKPRCHGQGENQICTPR
jgi:hypothetical protein